VKVGGIQSQGQQDLCNAFMGAVEEPSTQAPNPWVVTLRLNGKPVDFCIDTGAEVTVISEQTHERAGCPPLLQADRTLRGPDMHILPVCGQFTATLMKGNQQFEEKIYVDLSHY